MFERTSGTGNFRPLVLRLTGCLLVAGSLAVAACSGATEGGGVETGDDTAQTGYVAPPTFVADLDGSRTTSAPRPQDDYYLARNLDWLQETEVDPAKGYASTFQTLDVTVRDRLQEIGVRCAVAQQQGTLSPDSDAYRIASAYRCALDMDGRDAAGLGGMAAPLAAVSAATTLPAYEQAIGEMAGGPCRTSILGGFSVAAASNRQGVYTVCLQDPELFMSKDYYASADYARYQEALKTYLAQVLVLYGYAPDVAARRADDVYAMLTELAAASLDRKQRYDPAIASNILDHDQLAALYPHVDMDLLLGAAGISPADGVNTWEVAGMDEAAVLDGFFTEENLETLKAYSIVVTIDGAGDSLTTAYLDAYRTFYDTIDGATQHDSAEAVATEQCDRLLATPYGKQYVERYFSSEGKRYVTDLAHQILDVYRHRIECSTWLSDEAKQTAYAKLEQMTIKIGYPDRWETWLDGVVLEPPEEGGTYIDCVLAVRRSKLVFDRSRIDQPVDRSEWGMSPQTVNAYYDPTMNEIVFPAGILQAPFFDTSASRGANLGGIGAVIAHEVSHSFDDNGSAYDETGAVRDWWTEADHEAFETHTAAYVAYYDRYELWDGSFEDGAKTLGENIADSTGVACVCDVMAEEAGMRTSFGTGVDPTQASADDQAAYRAELQEMFEAYATVWRSRYSDAARDKRLTGDVHSFGYVRTDAVLSSCDAFYYAYDVQEGDGMYVAPGSRIGVW